MGYVQVYHGDPDTAIYLANLEMDMREEEARRTEQAKLARLEESRARNDTDVDQLCFGMWPLEAQMKTQDSNMSNFSS